MLWLGDGGGMELERGLMKYFSAGERVPALEGCFGGSLGGGDGV